jgi:hypothetical protein
VLQNRYRELRDACFRKTLARQNRAVKAKANLLRHLSVGEVGIVRLKKEAYSMDPSHGTVMAKSPECSNQVLGDDQSAS